MKLLPLPFLKILCVMVIVFSVMPLSALAANNAYGDGNYGACTYEGCSISLTSLGSVAINAAPAAGSTKCTVQSDTLSVLTDSSTGYNLTFKDTAASSNLINGGNTIAVSSGTAASPLTLTANSWGYRVDNQAGFGAGPTSAGTNVATPGLTFAGAPNSSQTADTLASSSSAADPAVNTTVWYGVCVNTSVPSGTYSSSVTYTAIIN